MTTTATRPRYLADTTVLIVAKAIHAEILRHRARYEEARDDWYRSGDGRSPNWRVSEHGHPYNAGGRGYKFPEACEHGSDAWVDYDNICGPCEDGYSDLEIALAQAHAAVNLFHKRSDPILALIGQGAPTTMLTELRDWAWEALDDHMLVVTKAPCRGRLP